MSFYWLSFCSTSLPEGHQFLGACIVEAASEKAAVARTMELGINPGGEVLILQCPDNPQIEAHARPHRDKLLTFDEIENVFGAGTLEAIPEGAPRSVICQDCNHD